MSPDSRARLAAAVTEVRDEYVRDLPAKLADLADLVRVAREDASTLRRAADVAHRIHGTASSLGLDRIGGAAGRIEEAIERMIEGELPRDRAWSIIDTSLADLRALSHEPRA